MLLFYVIIRLLLLNVNYTEWGDTFRMIRGSSYLSHFQWPWDEKRWPLYSLFLLPGIWISKPIIWGRLLGILISVVSSVFLYLFYIENISKKKRYAVLAVVFMLLSPVYAYWSVRVMADPLFLMLVISYFYYFIKFVKNREIKTKEIWLLSSLLLLITMTRLEGLFVVAGMGLYYLVALYEKYKANKTLNNLLKDL